jgi:phytanoyl-CoA hydroxylase
MVLTADQLAAWERDGFLAIPGFASPDACEALKRRVALLVEAFDPATVRTVFSTRNQVHTTDDYFLGSGDQVRFFFEEGAFDAEGRLRQDKALSINKIGHALHDRDPVFDRFSRDPRLASICAGIGMREPLLMQSMYIFKQPRIGGEVVCHQDSTFLYTEPESVVGLWFAIEDATLENGCMWALPGGHRLALKRRFHRDGSGRVVYDELDPTPFPPETPEAGYVPLEARQGTLILLHGRLPHRSGPNLSDRSRHAYTVHVVDGACRYLPDNWLVRPESDPARGFG